VAHHGFGERVHDHALAAVVEDNRGAAHLIQRIDRASPLGYGDLARETDYSPQAPRRLGQIARFGGREGPVPGAARDRQSPPVSVDREPNGGPPRQIATFEKILILGERLRFVVVGDVLFRNDGLSGFEQRLTAARSVIDSPPALLGEIRQELADIRRGGKPESVSSKRCG
jgi:hypothetical protein